MSLSYVLSPKKCQDHRSNIPVRTDDAESQRIELWAATGVQPTADLMATKVALATAKPVT